MAFMALPTLLIAIVIVAILGLASNLIVAISLAMILIVHSARSFVRTELQKEYILAARLDGKPFAVGALFRATKYVAIADCSDNTRLATAILDVTALGFLRLGVEPPQQNWRHDWLKR